MVNYAYESLFRKSHLEKDFIIVNADATVTPVSNNEPTITDADFVIRTEDLETESFTLDESLCSEDNLTFGLMESAQVSFVIKNKSEFPNLRNTKIAIYMYFNGDSATLFPIGIYTCTSDKYTADRRMREVQGADDNYFLWDYDITAWYNDTFVDNGFYSVQTLRESLFAWLNDPDGGDYPITLKLLDNDGSLNDDYLIGKTIESDVITFGFFMSKLLELRGCFGHINRVGEFEQKWLVPYDEPAVKVISDDIRILPTEYEDDTVWGIGYVAVYDRNNIRRFRKGSSSYKHPSTYSVVDSFVFEEVNRPNWKPDTEEAVEIMRNAITHRRYKACEVQCEGNLCLEVGDQIDVQYGNSDSAPQTFYTYILERHFKGIQSFRDVYTAKGDRKQPKYKVSNDNWHVGDSENVSTSGEGSGGVSELNDEHDKRFCEIIRNIGLRLLDEPTDVSVEYNTGDSEVSIKWTDPSDISTTQPISATWTGTIVIRKENSAPLNIYDGTVLVDSTTRDAYKTTAFVDSTIDENKRYYYGIFPYDSSGNVRFTKVVSVNTEKIVIAPLITDVHMGGAGQWDGSEIAILWSGNSNSLTVQISNSSIVFKLYTGDTEIYSFTSPVGSSVADVDKIHVAFLKDDTNEVAKPSFVYYTGTDVYSYNQESPTDAEMGLIYTWLSAGLPSS